MKMLASLIFNRWVMSALGLAAACLLVWWIGPLIGIASYRPLEPETVRWIVIALILLGWVARLAIRLVRKKQANARMMEGLLPAAAARAPDDGGAAEEVAVLGKRFEDAVEVLKKARLGARPATGARWFGALSRQWVYELPWYMFIGAPGSGKTTALVNSGLQFPLRERFGERAIRGVSGTRNCDWWFTDQAVLLDTAGRYTTQESNQKADGAAWTGFLQLLKKYRARRAINGVLLTLSVPDLLDPDPDRREAHLEALRRRLAELHQELDIRFPVYVIITKLDLLPGFMEFFGDFSKEERAQVWGMSLPYLASPGEQDAPLALRAEFAALEQRLNARLVERLQQERDLQKRAQLYQFPQQVAGFTETASSFIEELFAPSRFASAPLLRGVYLTSGTQEGSPIDRMMGGLGRALRLERQVLAPHQASAKSFFITRLLNEVVFREAGLAGTNLRAERRRKLAQTGALVCGALVCAVLVAGWTISHARNRAYLAEVQARLQSAGAEVAQVAGQRSGDIVALLPTLRAVRELAHPANGTADAPLLMHLGLYQGDKLDSAAANAYRRLLHDTFLPRLVTRTEQLLRGAGRDNPELLYEALKAYLMLHQGQHLDQAALTAFMRADWASSLPREVGNEARAALDQHLAALLDSGDVTPPQPVDTALVADARRAVAQTPLARRVYNRLLRQGIGDKLPPFTIAGAAGPAAALVFTRASGEPLTSGVPGLFSYAGYHQHFVSASARVTGQLAEEEDWVLGLQRGAQEAAPAPAMVEEVRRLYLAEYARTWDKFIEDIKLVRAGNLAQSIQLARILSAPDSPLPQLLRAIVKEVTLAPPAGADKGVIEKAGDKVKDTRDDLLKLWSRVDGKPAAPAAIRPESAVDAHFESLRRLANGAAPGQPAPIDGVTALINELYMQLNATEAALKGGNVPPASEVPARVKAEGSHQPEPVRSMLQGLAAGGSSNAVGLARGNLSSAIETALGEFCRKAVSGRYPFTSSSGRDVTQDDFARLFAPGGLIDDFFQKNLAALVNTSTRPWRFRDQGDATLTDPAGTLLQFQRAQTIRDVFFRGATAAAIRFDLKPVAMDATITQFLLDVDGQSIKYSHGPQVAAPVQWPGPRGGTGVRYQLTPPLAGAPSGKSFDGAWALFRLFDQAQIDATQQPEKFLATFSADGRKTQFEVTTSSVRNPFRLRELEQFQCPGKL